MIPQLWLSNAARPILAGSFVAVQGFNCIFYGLDITLFGRQVLFVTPCNILFLFLFFFALLQPGTLIQAKLLSTIFSSEILFILF